MYAVTPEFTPHLLTFVLPRDNDDRVSGSHRERCTINLGDLEVWAFSLSLVFSNNSERFCSGGMSTP